MAQRLAEMVRDLAENRDRLKRIRGELLRERRAERPSELPPARSVWAELDALGAARLLDEVSVALTPPSEFVEDELPLEHEPMVLPPGISPDHRSAVEWLLDRRSAFVLIVDGYNVTFLMDPDSFTGGERRNHLNAEVARFRRMAAAKPRVIVVYDSDQTGGITSESGSGGVEVRFTTAGHSADEEVLVLATELGGAAVVVSTDRRVREGAERVGALGLWSQAPRGVDVRQLNMQRSRGASRRHGGDITSNAYAVRVGPSWCSPATGGCGGSPVWGISPRTPAAFG